jgi:carboxypeptidase PM20D1
MPLTDAEAVEALRSAVSFKTVASPGPDPADPAPFEALLGDLAERFPRLHEVAQVVRVATDEVLMRWPGRGGDRPIVLLAHLDVEPVDPDEHWTHPPFGGVVDDGVVWGRGTLDHKGSAVAMCTAVERLLEDGFVPASDVWLSFGCDRTVGGSGTSAAVQALRERDVDPWFVLDEGGTIADDAFPGVTAPLAVIGVSEKGLADIELRARQSEGTASMPARRGSAERLARAIDRMSGRTRPASLPDPVVEMLEAVSPHASGPVRFATRFARPLRPVLALVFARLGPETAALARTTSAVTAMHAEPAGNGLAGPATATAHLRIAVDDTVAAAVERIRTAIGDDAVDIDVLAAEEPSPVSPRDDPAYELLTSTVRDVMAEVVPVPYVMLAPTHARFFHRAWPRVYRFTPFRMTRSQRRSLHEADERLDVSSFLEGVRWYQRLLEQV